MAELSDVDARDLARLDATTELAGGMGAKMVEWARREGILEPGCCSSATRCGGAW